MDDYAFYGSKSAVQIRLDSITDQEFQVRPNTMKRNDEE
jgi:hypothetical protein